MITPSANGADHQRLRVLTAVVENNPGVLSRMSGMVRQFQDDFYGGVRSEVDLSDMPDFVKLADAYGLPGIRVDRMEQMREAFDFAERTPGPVLIDFQIDPEANVYPIVPLGKGLNDFTELPDEYA